MYFYLLMNKYFIIIIIINNNNNLLFVRRKIAFKYDLMCSLRKHQFLKSSELKTQWTIEKRL